MRRTIQAMMINGYHIDHYVGEGRYRVSPYRSRHVSDIQESRDLDDLLEGRPSKLDMSSGTEMRDVLFADKETAERILARQVALSDAEPNPPSGYGWAEGYELENLEAEGRPNIWRIAEPYYSCERRTATLEFGSVELASMLDILTISANLRAKIGLPRDLPKFDEKNRVMAA
jgi:hypothetical protein